VAQCGVWIDYELHTDAFADYGVFCIAVGDSLLPGGGERILEDDPALQATVRQLVRVVCAEYNEAVVMGRISVAKMGQSGTYAPQHIDYRDYNLVDEICKSYFLGLLVHKQGPNMCAFQAAQQIRTITDTIHTHVQHQTSKAMAWPALHMQGRKGVKLFQPQDLPDDIQELYQCEKSGRKHQFKKVYGLENDQPFRAVVARKMRKAAKTYQEAAKTFKEPQPQSG
jgi:hypothetical protein